MKTVGIIGGLGPKTTAEFYIGLISECYNENKERRPSILIWNVPINYAEEANFLKFGTGKEKYLPYLIDAARHLEKGGADFIVIPCNSVHIFINEIRESVKIPLFSIVEETIKFLKDKKIEQVGILATSTTLNMKLYENGLAREGIRQISPTKAQQWSLNLLINNLVLGTKTENDRKTLNEIIDSFSDKSISDVLLACTDLQLIVKDHPKLKVHDTMAILMKATVKEILS